MRKMHCSTLSSVKSNQKRMSRRKIDSKIKKKKNETNSSQKEGGKRGGTFKLGYNRAKYINLNISTSLRAFQLIVNSIDS